MQSNRQRALQGAIDLCWSLWRELGVAGPLRRHQQWLVIPEPLILLTAFLADDDRRLRDHAVAWCAEFLPLISASALRHTYTRERWPIGAIADFSATLRVVAKANWVGAQAGSPFPARREYEGSGPPFSEPARVALRLRGAFGVSTRTEVIRTMLTVPGSDPTIADLAESAMATKRHTAEAVDHLEWSGFVAVDRRKNPYRVHLRRRDPLVALVQPLPDLNASWAPACRFIAAAVGALTDVAELPDDIAAPELHRRLRHVDEQLARLRLEPPRRDTPTEYRVAVEEWLVALIEDVAAGSADSLVARPIPAVA